MAIAKVCTTVFSCAVNGCLVHPSRSSAAVSGFRIRNAISPAAIVPAFRTCVRCPWRPPTADRTWFCTVLWPSRGECCGHVSTRLKHHGVLARLPFRVHANMSKGEADAAEQMCSGAMTSLLEALDQDPQRTAAPIGMLKVGTMPKGPSANRIVMKPNSTPRMMPKQMARSVNCVYHGGSDRTISSSVSRSGCSSACGTRPPVLLEVC